MDYSLHRIGDQTSVAQRFGSENGFVRPERLNDVLCVNTSGGTLYMQIFEVNAGLVPFGTAYTAGSYSLTGLTAGHTYSYKFGPNDGAITPAGQGIISGPGAGTFVATGTTLLIASTGGAAVPVTLNIVDVTVPQATPVPIEGAIPTFSFPVQAGLGGTLGREADMSGIYCCWSSTQATKTIAAASGSIVIEIKA